MSLSPNNPFAWIFKESPPKKITTMPLQQAADHSAPAQDPRLNSLPRPDTNDQASPIELSPLEHHFIVDKARKLGITPERYLSHCVCMIERLDAFYADHNHNLSVNTDSRKFVLINLLP